MILSTPLRPLKRPMISIISFPRSLRSNFPSYFLDCFIMISITPKVPKLNEQKKIREQYYSKAQNSHLCIP
jgi:hypothetical protein